MVVTEREWLAATDPTLMMNFLQKEKTSFGTRSLGWIFPQSFPISERKWRLFSVACCRRIMHLMPVVETRQLIELVERFADCQATEAEIKVGIQASMNACTADTVQRQTTGADWSEAEWEASDAVERCHSSEEGGCRRALQQAALAWACRVHPNGRRIEGLVGGHPCVQTSKPWETEVAAEHARQAAILRDIVGNPFGRAAVDSGWLAWHDGTIPRIARRIHDERRFEDMPILADALEDAGCCDEAILTHCRGENGHVRGCWVLDLLLSLS
jgi:hypothetical protein